MANLWTHVFPWVWPLGVLAASIAAALIVHRVIFAIGKRVAARRGGTIERSLTHHAEGPTRWILPLLAIVLALPALPVRSDLVQVLRHVVGLGLIAAIAWSVILLTQVLGDLLYSHYNVNVGDNLTARRVRTQTIVLQRVIGMVVVIVTAGVMLMTFPAIRQVGTSVLASAGIAGIVVGMAMKPTFSNLLAGLQIAFTAPIRIDDVVIVGTEFGWIEEILTTYVVVRTWDLRRLIVPLSYFIENMFQNWTRNTADLLAAVTIYCDYTAPVDELRKEFQRILDSTPLWDHKVMSLQVTDARADAIEIRALTSAADSGKAWDLRCYVREGLIRFLQERYPECLPKTRAQVSGFPEERFAAPQPAGRPAEPGRQGGNGRG